MQPDDTTLDAVLTLQLAVAWAGEADTDPPRLGWWRTAMVDPYGGEDLLRTLAPRTWPWATLQAAREAARRTDAIARGQAHDPDRIVTLFRFGFALDEALDDRLRALKTAQRPPAEALPDLGALLASPWDPARFDDWLAATCDASPAHDATPLGRRLKAPPTAPALLARHLAAALRPVAGRYPLPHVAL
ncbi:MAG: BREX-6 system BrxE protein [Deltaproteobacteria bacterium]|nr:MAG: BREX-6 system BrxE protein [Deltaproteobacteria bacterium]